LEKSPGEQGKKNRKTETNKQINQSIDRQADREAGRQTDRETDRERDRQRKRDRDSKDDVAWQQFHELNIVRSREFSKIHAHLHQQ